MISRAWDGRGNYNGPVPWVMSRFSLSQEELRVAMPHDVDRARRLMAEAGYENGFRATLKLPHNPGAPFFPDLAGLIKEQVGRIGIELILDEASPGTFIANVVLSGNFEVAFSLSPLYDEPDRPLSFYHTHVVREYPGWRNSNPEVDRLIEAQESEFDGDERTEIIFEAQRLILKEHGPQITLPSGNIYRAHWRYVHNPLPGFFGFNELEVNDDGSGPPGTDTWTERAQPAPTKEA